MAVLQQHVVRLQSLNLYKEVSVAGEVSFSPSCIQTFVLFFFFLFVKAVTICMKLQCQKEMDLEKVRLGGVKNARRL